MAINQSNKTNEINYSDGIARVHGMANVQAEELVEYVPLCVILMLFGHDASYHIALI